MQQIKDESHKLLQ